MMNALEGTEYLAAAITGQTLVGSWGEFPRSSGNCFGVRTADGKHFQIVNFKVENLEELVRRGLRWPVRIAALGERLAVINDERIPDDWYDDQYCEVCCPTSLLPPQQRLKHRRDVLRGWRREDTHSVMIMLADRELPPLDSKVKL